MKSEISALAQKIPVLIAGRGSIGLTLTALLSRYGVACDGGHSTVREALAIQLLGTQCGGKCVVVDIVQKTRRSLERLAWFNPPSKLDV